MKNYEDLGLDNKLRKADSLGSRPRNWQSEFDQDAQVERSPFGHPTQIHKGNLTITGGGTLTVKDATGGTTTFTIDPTSGSITQVGDLGLTGDAAISGGLTVGGTSITGAYAKGDFNLAIHPGPRQWTTNATWTNINSTDFALDGDSFALTDVYFEVLGCVEVSGYTADYRIYNVTDGTPVANATISTDATSAEASGWVDAERVRSSALIFTGGEKAYRLQFQQDTAGGEGTAAQFFKGNLFYTIS